MKLRAQLIGVVRRAKRQGLPLERVLPSIEPWRSIARKEYERYQPRAKKAEPLLPYAEVRQATIDEKQQLLEELRADIEIAGRLGTGIDTATLERTCADLERELAETQG